jgi:hypothetical protein
MILTDQRGTYCWIANLQEELQRLDLSLPPPSQVFVRWKFTSKLNYPVEWSLFKDIRKVELHGLRTRAGSHAGTHCASVQVGIAQAGGGEEVGGL